MIHIIPILQEFYHPLSKVILLFVVVQSLSSLWPHGLQHTRPPCPSPTPRVYSNPCPLSRWCHPTISSSVIPVSSHFQSFPASGSFQMSQFIGVSASTSVMPMNIQDWFPLIWTGLISVHSKGLFKSLLQHHSSKALILQQVQLSHLNMTSGKTIALTRRAFVGKVMSLPFNTLFNTLFLIRTVKVEETCQVKRKPSTWDGGKWKWGITHFFFSLDFVFQRLHDHLFI